MNDKKAFKNVQIALKLAIMRKRAPNHMLTINFTVTVPQTRK